MSVPDASQSIKPSQARVIIISDVHLGTKSCQAAYLIEFLRSLDLTTLDHLIINGDFFDGWDIEKNTTRPYLDELQLKVIDEINYIAANTKVTYIPGNHDEKLMHYLMPQADTVRLKKFLEDTTNKLRVKVDDFLEGKKGKKYTFRASKSGQDATIHFARGLIHETLNGKRYAVQHGHQFDIWMMSTLKGVSKGAGKIYESLLATKPPEYAGDESKKSGHYTKYKPGRDNWSLNKAIKSVGKQASGVKRAFRKAAASVPRDYGLDGIILGHIHELIDRQVNGYHYLNSGDWKENCSALIEDRSGTFHAIDWMKKRKNLGYEDEPEIACESNARAYRGVTMRQVALLKHIWQPRDYTKFRSHELTNIKKALASRDKAEAQISRDKLQPFRQPR